MTSYFVDTNYILRFLIRDNEPQFKIVNELFHQAAEKKITLNTSVIVIFELYWVLISFYKQDKLTILRHLSEIVTLGIFQIENIYIIDNALQLYAREPLDFEDCYNLAYSHHSNLDNFASFDRQALKKFSSMK